MPAPQVSSFKIALQSAALAVLFASASAAATISGKVTDAQTGNPLASMIVAAYSTSGVLQGSATSDSTGRYSITLSNGSYRVLAYDNNGVYATTFYGDAESFESTTPISPDASNINFALRRAGTVSGSVSTSTGASSGITVAAYNPDGSRRGFTTTNATGSYSLVLPPGNYKLAAYDDNGTFWPRFFDNQSTFGAASVVAVAAGQNSTATFSLDAVAHVTGTIFDGATGQPLRAIVVDAYDSNGALISEAASDVNGAFTLRVPPGTFRVVASDPQHAYANSYYGGVSFDTATTLRLTAAATQSVGTISMQRAGGVPVETFDTNGSPVTATVAAYALDGTLRGTVQSTNGTLGILYLPAGTYKLAAYDPNLVYATQFYDRQTTFATATPIKVDPGLLTPGPILLFSLSRGARVSGTVVDTDTSAVVPGITVAAYDTTGNVVTTTTTDARGIYAAVLPSGTYRFVAFDNALHYAAAFAGGSSYETGTTYTLSSNSVEQINFRMTRGIRVGGIVTDSSGAGVSGIQVSALDPSGNHVGTATTTNGAFDLILLPNQYRFIATDPQSRFVTTLVPSPVTLAWGSPSPTVTITLLGHSRRRSVPH